MRIQISTNTKGNLDKCIQFYKRLDNIKKFQNDYLNDLKVDVNAVIDTEFQEYIDFINQIKKYIEPKLISVNPKLQTIIDNYANNIDSKTFINLMELSSPCLSLVSPNCDIIKNPKFSEVIHTNLNILHTEDKKTKYTIFLHMDFVEGQLDRAVAENKGILSKLNCMFNDALLTRQFNDLAYKKNTNTWIVQPAPFIQVEIPKEITSEIISDNTSDDTGDNTTDDTRTTIPDENLENTNFNRQPIPSVPSVPYAQPVPSVPWQNPPYPPKNPFFSNPNHIAEPNIVKRYDEPFIQQARPIMQNNPYRGGKYTLKKRKNKRRFTKKTI